jgi:STAM-binding protein
MNSPYSTDDYTQSQLPRTTISRAQLGPTRVDPKLTSRRPNPAQPRTAFPSHKASRPHSIPELAEVAKQSIGDDARPFKTWLRMAGDARRDAQIFQEQGDLESAFVEFAKAAMITLEKIPDHPNNILTLSQKHNMSLVSYLPLAPHI